MDRAAARLLIVFLLAGCSDASPPAPPAAPAPAEAAPAAPPAPAPPAAPTWTPPPPRNILLLGTYSLEEGGDVARVRIEWEEKSGHRPQPVDPRLPVEEHVSHPSATVEFRYDYDHEPGKFRMELDRYVLRMDKALPGFPCLVSADGHLPVAASMRARSDYVYDLAVRFEKPRTLRGTVRDPEGKAIPDAEVRVIFRQEEADPPEEDRDYLIEDTPIQRWRFVFQEPWGGGSPFLGLFTEGSIHHPGSAREYLAVKVVTGPDGGFAVSPVPGGDDAIVLLTAPGRAPRLERFPAERFGETLPITLGAAVPSPTLRLLDPDGVPLPGETVHLQPADLPLSLDLRLEPAVTGADGTFTSPLLQPGAHFLLTTDPEPREGHTLLGFRAREPQATFTAEDGATIRLEERRPDGQVLWRVDRR